MEQRDEPVCHHLRRPCTDGWTGDHHIYTGWLTLPFRSWRVYGEHGLPGQPAVIWLYGETLTIALNDVALAQYRVNYQPDLKHLRTIDEPRMFDNPYRSPQLPLWELGDDEWLKVVRLPDYPRRTPQRVMGTQAALPF